MLFDSRFLYTILTFNALIRLHKFKTNEQRLHIQSVVRGSIIPEELTIEKPI